MGTQLLGDCSSPCIARTGKYSTGRYLLVRFTQPEDIFRWMGGFLTKLGAGRRAIPHFLWKVESGFLIDKTQVYKNWIVLFYFADFGIFFCT
jgi:hypothetical protein